MIGIRKDKYMDDIGRLKLVKMTILAKLVCKYNTILINIPGDFFA